MKKFKSKNIKIALILTISFLFESSLLKNIIVLPIALQALSNVFNALIFPVAIAICFCILSSKSIIKSIGVAAAFLIFDQIVSKLFYSNVLALIYSIIRPIIIVAFIFFTKRLITKCSPSLNLNKLIIIGISFLVGAACNIIEYVRMILLLQNTNDYFAIIGLMSNHNSIFNVMEIISTYVIAYILLYDKEEENEKKK